jgi:hypothetical protein
MVCAAEKWEKDVKKTRNGEINFRKTLGIPSNICYYLCKKSFSVG